jgi:anti-sigma regulatory factor (Ser/Thr protein kinase)
MPVVEIRFTALPEHVRTARLIAAAVARRAGIDGPLLDEIRLAVGEACSRAVAGHQRLAPDRPVTVTVSDDRDTFVVTVADNVGPTDGGQVEADPFAVALERVSAAPGGDDLVDALPSGFGLAVIAGLVDDLDVVAEPTGTLVRMTWKTTGSAPPPSTAAVEG